MDNADKAEDRRDFQIHTLSLIAIHDTRHIDSRDFLVLLNQLVETPFEIQIDGERYSLPFGGNARLEPHYNFQPLHAPRREGPLRLPYLSISDSTFQPQIGIPERALDAELYVSDPPFRGIKDLISELGFDTEILSPNYSPTIEVLARAPIKLSPDSGFRGNELFVGVTIPKTMEPGIINFRTIIVNRSGPVERTTITSDLDLRERDDHSFDVCFSQKADSALWAFVFVVYGEDHLGEFQIYHPSNRPNPLVEIHEQIYGATNWKSLLPEIGAKYSKDFQHRFETFASILLSMIGLRILNYVGIKEFSDGPDILAVTGASDLLVVECTLGYPNSEGKLLKLSERVRALRVYSADTKLQVRHIAGVIISNMESKDVEGARAEAASLGIALLCREEIISLLDRARAHPVPSADDVWNSIKRKIEAKNAHQADPPP